MSNRRPNYPKKTHTQIRFSLNTPPFRTNGIFLFVNKLRHYNYYENEKWSCLERKTSLVFFFMCASHNINIVLELCEKVSFIEFPL